MHILQNFRFIQVETAFFWQWWQDQTEETKEITRQLVNSGRLEIVNAAWSMNDEAAAHYHSIIDQFTWGLKRINDTLGKCGRPKIGWQIDPFGHSKEMASIFSQIGYEGVFFARLDYRDNEKRHINKDLELIWQGSSDLGNLSNIFTGVLYDFYTAPAYFCWDVLCGDRPVIDNEKSSDYNVDTVVMKQTTSFAKYGHKLNFENNLTPLKEVMGIMQHHDAITGTEKQHVVQDYVRLLTAAVNVAEEDIDSIILNILKKTDDADDVKIKFSSCLMANVSHCKESNLDRFTVVVYNPLSRYVNHYVRLPVNGDSYTIVGPDGNINYEILPTIADFSYVDSITPSKKELVFVAENLPPLGLKYFYIQKSKSTRKKYKTVKQTQFGNNNCGFTIDEVTGLLSSATLNGVTLEISQNFMFYNGANGTNKEETFRASGAYIFRPATTTPKALSLANSVTYTAYITDIVEEVHQVFNNWIRQIIRVYKNENYIEFDWLVGPIALINDLGVEVVTQFVTKRLSNGVFYTDSNGKQMVKRIRNFREMYTYTDEEPISGNYYPITSNIVLKDGGSDDCSPGKNLEIAILNDRAQGGSSLEDGQMELMVHRRLLNDDAFGVGEPLNEIEFNKGVVVRGQHYLTFGQKNSCSKNSVKTAATNRRDIAQRKLLSPWVFVGDATSNKHTLENLQAKLNFEFSGLVNVLPNNVQILTLEPWTENKLLLRLEHIFSKDEDNVLSQPATVNIRNLFTLFNVVNIEEMSLAAHMPKAEIEKMPWNSVIPETLSRKFRSADLNIHIMPMEIRTFIVEVVAKTRNLV
ncbi:alpha-mannosidase [Holotrichia oblita]|uniref:Alpha-mannosidase n=1 Tax=Holotrichia oblita TaxID=644536 RepID=A0ACB9TUI3_HOLOL|nr:alpha-mannosidase [Holotrichia oblita]